MSPPLRFTIDLDQKFPSLEHAPSIEAVIHWHAYASKTLDQAMNLPNAKQAAYDELVTIWDECKIVNWDGDDAFPVREQTFYNAYVFIADLPLGCPLLSVGAEPDGHITLEWYRHPRWTLSVSISPEGILYYAALFDSSDVRGSEVFCGEIPQTLLNLIQRVHIA